MKRLLLAVLAVLAWAGSATAQSDLTIWNLPCYPPYQTTNCVRAHADVTTAGTARANVTITGDIIAAGGYKTTLVYAHPNYIVPGSALTSVPISGAGPAIGAAGPLYIYPGFAGSIIAVSISSSAALTGQGASHAEAIRFDGTAAQSTGLRAVIGSGLAQAQYQRTTQARGLDIFTATEGIGCQVAVATSTTPTNAVVACMITVTQ